MRFKISRVMNTRFWDRIASNFDNEVFDTLANDRNRTLLSHIDRFSSAESTACDFGCGVGRYVPLLAERFKTVCATDVSRNCLTLARDTCRGFDNVVYVRADLYSSRLKLGKFDFGISVNVLLEPAPQKRRRVLDNMFRHIANKGHILVVVPSLESALYSNLRLSQWNDRSGHRQDERSAIKLPRKKSRGADVINGILNLDGVLAKHYLREELFVSLEDVGFEVSHVDRVEYPWIAIFDNPPRWMKDPYPWDWLAICHKK